MEEQIRVHVVTDDAKTHWHGAHVHGSDLRALVLKVVQSPEGQAEIGRQARLVALRAIAQVTDQAKQWEEETTLERDRPLSILAERAEWLWGKVQALHPPPAGEAVLEHSIPQLVRAAEAFDAVVYRLMEEVPEARRWVHEQRMTGGFDREKEALRQAVAEVRALLPACDSDEEMPPGP